MKLFDLMDKKIKKMHWYDISLIKLSTAAATLLIAKFWPAVLSLDVMIYLLVALGAAIIPVSKLFTKK